jgi:hypothetical protein
LVRAGSIAAGGAAERYVAAGSAVFALRDDIGSQRAPSLTTMRIQVDASEGKYATEQ